jgi:hypothetical protein
MNMRLQAYFVLPGCAFVLHVPIQLADVLRIHHPALEP